VKNGNILYSFVSPLNPGNTDFALELEKHGDGVKDVAFLVEDARAMYEKAVKRGAKSIREPEVLEDENGQVVIATIQTYGDTHHSFIERRDFKGVFLPGFKPHHLKEKFNKIAPIPELDVIDHCVGNQEDNQMEPTAQWYEKMLDFHRFWSVDDSIIHTEYSSLRSVVVTDFDENVKMPINEPANGKRKSQI
jgi:4-hydroxyphenylpyruvate dioxygenase